MSCTILKMINRKKKAFKRKFANQDFFVTSIKQKNMQKTSTTYTSNHYLYKTAQEENLRNIKQRCIMSYVTFFLKKVLRHGVWSPTCLCFLFFVLFCTVQPMFFVLYLPQVDNQTSRIQGKQNKPAFIKPVCPKNN